MTFLRRLFTRRAPSPHLTKAERLNAIAARAASEHRYAAADRLRKAALMRVEMGR